MLRDSREWYSTAEISGVNGLPKTQKGVISLAKKEGWNSRPRKGKGGGKEYHISNFPEKIQTSLLLIDLKNNPEKAPQNPALKEGMEPSPITKSDFNYCRESLWAHYDKQTDKKKVKAEGKLVLLQAVSKLNATGLTMIESFKHVAEAHCVSHRTMMGWYHGTRGKRGVKDYAKCDWLAALMPGHHGKSTTAECSPEAWEFYKSDYLRLEKPPYAQCYETLKKCAEGMEWKIPSESALRRRIQREIPRSVRVLLREGEHALMRMYPAQERDVSELHALEWINGDGYQHNVFVKWPNGTIARPKTWFWQDIYSRKMLSWRTDQTEHADLIILALGDLIEQYGIPSDYTIDNTRAAANKWLTGRVKNRYRFKIKEDDPMGLIPQLGGTVHWTTVHKGKGWGQAKPIERAFGVGGIGEYVDKAREFRGAYTGPNTTAKPENYGSTAIPLEKFLEVLEREMQAWNAREKRRTQICNGILSYDQAFNQSYAQAPIRKATKEQQRLWMLSGEGVLVKDDGSFRLEAGSAIGVGSNRYQNDILFDHHKQKIIVRFDPQNLHQSVHAYTLDGNYICECECIDRTGFGDRLAARQHQRARKEMLKLTKKAANAEIRMDDIEAAEYMPDIEDPTPPTSKVVAGVFPKNYGNTALNMDLDEAEEINYDEQFSNAINNMKNNEEGLL